MYIYMAFIGLPRLITVINLCSNQLWLDEIRWYSNRDPGPCFHKTERKLGVTKCLPNLMYSQQGGKQEQKRVDMKETYLYSA